MARLPCSAPAGQKDCPRAAPPLPHRSGVAIRTFLLVPLALSGLACSVTLVPSPSTAAVDQSVHLEVDASTLGIPWNTTATLTLPTTSSARFMVQGASSTTAVCATNAPCQVRLVSSDAGSVEVTASARNSSDTEKVTFVWCLDGGGSCDVDTDCCSGTCMQGACSGGTTPPSYCGGADLSTDGKNCGICGNACPTAQWCENYSCVGTAGTCSKLSPSPPVGLNAIHAPDAPSVLLTWKASVDSRGIAAYRVARSNDGGATYKILMATTDTRYIDYDVPPGHYLYEIAATDSAGCSSQASAQVDVTICDKPTPGSPADGVCTSGATPADFNTFAPEVRVSTDQTNGIAVGALTGSLNVTDKGQAVYTLPLPVPPGRRGNQPSLVVTYSSDAPTGNLGYHFNLVASSEIARCPTTLYEEGVLGSVTYTDSDALCLDGKKLLSVNGIAGSSDNEYRFQDTNKYSVRVTGRFDDKTPASFEVLRPDGSYDLYGGSGVATCTRAAVGANADGSTSVTGDGTVHDHWLLTRRYDAFGNYVQYDYAGLANQSWSPQNDYCGEPRLTEIDYAGWTDSTGQDAREPTRHVIVRYEDRGPAYPYGTACEGGVCYSQRTRVQLIEAHIDAPRGDTLAYTYRFGYKAIASGRSVLSTVTQCDGQGVCLKPTTFNWASTDPKSIRFTEKDYPSKYVEPASGISDPLYGGKEIIAADINGDGRTDIIYPGDDGDHPGDFGGKVPHLRFVARLADGDGFGPEYDLGIDHDAGGIMQVRAADVNGDGKTDLIMLTTTHGDTSDPQIWLEVWLSNGHTYSNAFAGPLVSLNNPALALSSTSGAYPDVFPVDVDGDGIPELFVFTPTADGKWEWALQRLFSTDGGQTISAPALEDLFVLGPMNIENGLIKDPGTGMEIDYFTYERQVDAVDATGRGVLDVNLPDWDKDSGWPTIHTASSLAVWDPSAEPGLGAVPLSLEVSKATKNYDVYDRLPSVHVYLDAGDDSMPDRVSIMTPLKDETDLAGNHYEIPQRPYFALQQNTGRGFAPAHGQPSDLPDLPWLGSLGAFDIDGDGTDDVLLVSTDNWGLTALHNVGLVVLHGNYRFAVLRNAHRPTSVGEFEYMPLDIPLQTTWDDFQFVDVNGDGLPDLVADTGDRNDGSHNIYIKAFIQDPRPPSELVNLVTDGNGFKSTIAYSSLAAMGPTQATCSYPRQCSIPPVTVVSETVDNHPSDPHVTVYKYDKPRTDLVGSRFLGFGQVVRTSYAGGFETKDARTYDFKSFGTSYPQSTSPAEEVVTHWAGIHDPMAPSGAGQTGSGTSDTFMPSVVSITKWDRQFQQQQPKHGAQLFDLTVLAERVRTVENYSGTDYEFLDRYTTTNYDAYDLPTEVVAQVDSSQSAMPQTIFQRGMHYNEDAINWRFMLAGETDTSYTLDGRSRSATTTFRYYPLTSPERGAVQYVTRDGSPEQTTPSLGVICPPPPLSPSPGCVTPPPHELTTEFDYTAEGLPSTVTESGLAQYFPDPPRNTTIRYDTAEAQFPVEITNALDQSSYLYSDRLTGAVAGSIDPNGIASWSFYDGFGRLKSIESPSGVTSYSYLPSTRGETWMLSVSSSTGAHSDVHYDLLSQPVLAEYITSNDPPRLQRTTYDWAGQIAERTNWYFDGAQQIPATTIVRDELERLKTVMLPNGGTYTIMPRLFSTTVVDPDQHKRAREFNELGQVSSSSVFDGTNPVTTTFDYGPFGLLEKVVDTPRHFDVAGAKREIDLDYDDAMNLRSHTLKTIIAGQIASSRTWQSDHNPFGELVLSKDPDDRQYQYTRDPLGRATQVVSSFGTETWNWGVIAPGIGKLQSTTSVDGTRVTYAYDDRGLLSSATEAVLDNDTLHVGFRYTTSGQPSEIIFPSVDSPTTQPPVPGTDIIDPDGRLSQASSDTPASLPLVVRYTYDGNGRLAAADAYNILGGGQHRVWEATGRDQANRVTNELFPEGGGLSRTQAFNLLGELHSQVVPGLGSKNPFGTIWDSDIENLTYSYTPSGDLRERADTSWLGTDQNFYYDFADRLSKWTVDQEYHSRATETYGYDDLGNLKSRTSTVDLEPWTYFYASSPSGQFEPAYDMDELSSVQHGGQTLTPIFDNSGRENLGLEGERITWGHWDTVTSLSDANGGRSRYYTADGQMAFEQTIASPATSTLAFGDLVKKVNDDVNGTTYFFTVPVVGSADIQVEYGKKPGESGYAVSTRYTFLDRLGTPDVVLDGLARKSTKLAYGPFGDRRDPQDVGTPHLGDDALPNSEPSAGATFGGHDASTFATLVDMGGRVYDPLEARFLSRDPVVQGPLDGASWHGFNYVRNNPASLVDPTGYGETDPIPVVPGPGQNYVYADVTNINFSDPEGLVDHAKRRHAPGAAGGKNTGGSIQGPSTGPAPVTGPGTSDVNPASASSVAAADGTISACRGSACYLPTPEVPGRSAINGTDWSDRALDPLYGAIQSLGNSLHSWAANHVVESPVSALYAYAWGSEAAWILPVVPHIGYSDEDSQVRAQIWGTIFLGAIGGVDGIVDAGANAALGDGTDAVINETTDEGANLVYRGLAADEDPAAGLVARVPDAGNSVASHVAGARASQWISTTRSLEVASSRFGENGVVAIDLSRVSSPVVDLTEGIPGLGPDTMLSRWAIKLQEVLVQGKIPAEAITPIR